MTHLRITHRDLVALLLVAGSIVVAADKAGAAQTTPGAAAHQSAP